MIKRTVFVLFIVAAIAGMAWAAGGKNQVQHHGDIGEGTVVQQQIRVDQ